MKKVTIYVRPLCSPRSVDHYSAWLSPRKDRYVDDVEWTNFVDAHRELGIEGTLCPERTFRSEWAGNLCHKYSFRLRGLNDRNMKDDAKGHYRESSKRRFLKAVRAIAPKGVIIKWL